MDVVIPCRSGDNEELRYTLRSIEKHYPYDNLWLIGDSPAWYSGNLFKLPAPRHSHHATNRAMHTLIDLDLISNEFAWFNDDFFVLRPTTPQQYNRGTIAALSASLRALGNNTSYVDGMDSTHAHLKTLGVETPLSYELHVPIIMERSNLAEFAEYRAGLTSIHNRSLYGNLFIKESTTRTDVKVLTTLTSALAQSDFLSSMDSTFNTLLPLLRKTFPDKSKWES